MLAVLIGASVGGFALYVGWRRIAFSRAYWRNRRHTDAYEQALRRSRARRAELRYRVADDRDELVVRRGELDPAAAELIAEGMSELGDLVACYGDDPPHALVRTFADPAGTCHAGVGLFASGKQTWLWIGSYLGDDSYVSSRASSSLAEPPFVHVERHAATTPVSQLVSRHRAFAGLDDPDRRFESVTSTQDLVTQFVHRDARVVAWRAAQPSDDLLDADLRAMLGEHHARLGKLWARRLRDELPRAIVQSK